MTNVISLDKFLSDRSDKNCGEFRAWLQNFAKRIADASYEPYCRYPLAFQAICAGWHMFINMDDLTDWWLPACVPTFATEPELCFTFLNGRSPMVGKEYATLGTITLGARKGTVSDVNYRQVFEEAIREHKPGAMNMYLPFAFIIAFAHRDMGFKYTSHEVVDDVATLVIQSLTERMTITFHIEQTRLALDELKTVVERVERVKGVTAEHDWTAFEDQRIPPKE
jgi:hypothetical protein